MHYGVYGNSPYANLFCQHAPHTTTSIAEHVRRDAAIVEHTKHTRNIVLVVRRVLCAWCVCVFIATRYSCSHFWVNEYSTGACYVHSMHMHIICNAPCVRYHICVNHFVSGFVVKPNRAALYRIVVSIVMQTFHSKSERDKTENREVEHVEPNQLPSDTHIVE